MAIGLFVLRTLSNGCLGITYDRWLQYLQYVTDVFIMIRKYLYV